MNSLQNRLLAAAIRAPSGDNCQPWVFGFRGDEFIEIYALPRRASSFFDYKFHGTLLSLGAVIENMRVQARCEGYAIEVDYDPNGSDTNLQATIRLINDETFPEIPGGLSEAVYARTVNRRPFVPVATAQSDIDMLLADPVTNVDTRVIRNRLGILRWVRLVYLGDRIRYSHPEIHRELFDKIRFTRAEAERFRTGLEIDRLGAGPMARSILTLIKPWSRMQALSRFGIGHALACQSAFTAFSTGSLVLLTLPTDERSLWIRTGEQMQRIWNGAQRLGLCTHPVTVVLYLDHRYQQEGMKDFLPQHAPLLQAIRSSLADLLGDRTGAMLFRLGRGWRMQDTAIRMHQEQFLLPPECRSSADRTTLSAEGVSSHEAPITR